MNTRRAFLLIFAAVIAMAQIVSANLGETPVQLQARYGKPTNGPVDFGNGVFLYTYAATNHTVQVEYLKGKSAMEGFQPNPGRPNFTDAQCLAIATAISGTTNWSVMTKDDEKTYWISDNYSASIQRRPGQQHYLLVRTAGWLAHELLHPSEDARRLLGGMRPNRFRIAIPATPPPSSTRETKAETDVRILKWHQELAGQGDAYGEYRMALRYRDGDGVLKDLEQARGLLQKSASQGNPDAAAALDKLPKPAKTDAALADITIQSATFGREGNLADVTEKVIDLLRAAPEGFLVNANTLEIDPEPGKKKQLKILYEYKGAKCELTIPTGTRLTSRALLKNAVR
jgi:hypothetical protein